MNWVPFATAATTVAVPVVTIVGAIWVKRLSKRQEESAAHKTDVEAHSVEVDTARHLLDDVRKMYAEQRTVNADDKIKHAEELAKMEEKVKSVEANQLATDRKLTVLLAGLAAHAPWDQAAYNALVATTPGYPPPPPIDASNGSSPQIC